METKDLLKESSIKAQKSNGKKMIDEKFACINDIPFEIKPGETILSFLRRNTGENSVPTLCDAPNLKPFGSVLSFKNSVFQ